MTTNIPKKDPSQAIDPMEVIKRQCEMAREVGLLEGRLCVLVHYAQALCDQVDKSDCLGHAGVHAANQDLKSVLEKCPTSFPSSDIY